MNIQNCKIVPARVVDIKSNGIIKVDAPGICSSINTTPSKLPDIHPFTMGGTQKISIPEKTSSVWLIADTKNSEYYYLPKFEQNYDTAELSSKENSEILFNITDDNSTIYYNSEDGINIKVGNTKIIVQPEEITIETKSGNTININEDAITLGKIPSSPAIKGDKLITMLENINECISDFINKTNVDPYTVELYSIFENIYNIIEDSKDGLKSNIVKID